MASIAPAIAIVHPSYMEPGLILPYTQVSGFLGLFGGNAPLVRLGEGDLYVYGKRIDVRTKVAAGQSAYNLLPSIDTTLSLLSTPTYLLRVRAEYDHHDVAAMNRWGVSLPQAQTLGMRQGHFQLARNAGLYGFNPQNGEGIVNAVGATAINLPPDSFGHTTVSDYDSGQMAMFLLSRVAAIKTRTNQLGQGRKFSFLGPQRVFSGWEYQDIVQLTSFQRAGAGTDQVKGVVNTILMSNGDEVSWGYDDTLQGKGAGGTDLVIITMPEVEKPEGTEGQWSTNEFAKLEPGLNACVAMYCDMAAPREITVPLPAGATDTTSEWRISSGWVIRPEAVDLISMPYN